MDWRLLGFDKDEPWQERSNSKQDKFNKETISKTNQFLSDTFIPALKESLEASLGMPADVYMANKDETVIFAYPRMFESSAILDTIRLETGPLAAWTPTEEASVTPYVAESRPAIFKQPSTSLVTVLPERTFWEKATILHQEANRPEAKDIPARYSRHYYDIYMLGNSHVKDAALGNLGLLEKVVGFKEKFYRTPWAKLADAKPGTFKLIPPEYRRVELLKDYKSMQDMLMGERPDFEQVMSYMKVLEDEINAL